MQTIIETLESIKMQTYPNLEVLLLDDHSTDDTVKVAKEWAENNKDTEYIQNIRIIVNEKNLGVAANLNKGIRIARGKYIQEVAADDILMPECCYEKVKYAKKYDANVVYAKVEVFGGKRAVMRVDEMKRFAARGYKICQRDHNKQLEEMAQANYIAGPSGGFFNTEFMLSEMGGYDERFPLLEDWPFHLKYLQKGYTIRFMDQVLNKYRVSGGSLSTGMSQPYIKCNIDFFLQERLRLLLDLKKFDVIQSQWKGYQEQLSRTNDRQYGKFRLYYDELYQWLAIKQEKKDLVFYFRKYGYQEIAIYGMGDIGRLLEKDMRETDEVKIVYAIDQNNTRIDSELKVIGIDEELPIVDAIVVTPTFAFDDVYRMLKKRTNCPIISFHDVVAEVYSS